MNYRNFITANPFTMAYDGEEPAPVEPVAPVTPAEPAKIEFTPEQQAFIDKQLAEKAEGNKRVMAELEALRARTDLTDGQRADLEDRFSTMQKELLTKEELFEQEKKRNAKQFEDEVSKLTSERDTWQTRYTQSTINREIVDAAHANEAFDGDALISMLGPKTDLIEALDSNGQSTGTFKPQVKFTDPEGKDGKPTELVLPVSEAVKRMTELPKYQYLFKGKGTGGIGGNNQGGGKPADAERLAQSPEAYREARKNGTLTI